MVLGAGMAGLAAARCLQEAGRAVLVLDKGRRIGGRCATRRIAGFSFDHGAQYVTARGPDFASLCEAARQAGLLAEWVSPAGKNVLSGRQAMRDLPGFLGQGLTIRQEVEITRIHREAGRYHLFAGQQLVARAESWCSARRHRKLPVCWTGCLTGWPPVRVLPAMIPAGLCCWVLCSQPSRLMGQQRMRTGRSAGRAGKAGTGGAAWSCRPGQIGAVSGWKPRPSRSPTRSGRLFGAGLFREKRPHPLAG